jgi:hypothetical protein
MEGKEAWKILLRSSIISGTSYGKKICSNVNLQIFLMSPTPIKLKGTLVARSVAKVGRPSNTS